MNIELSETDILFIYGHFQKELSKIDKIASSENCSFDKKSITNEKLPYLSVVEKIRTQIPNIQKVDNCF